MPVRARKKLRDSQRTWSQAVAADTRAAEVAHQRQIVEFQETLRDVLAELNACVSGRKGALA